MSTAFPYVDLAGVRVSALMYGTAWKEGDTEALVTSALRAGFRSIDTANPRQHSFEAGVGAALKAAFSMGLERSALFLQSKFTSRSGQDARLPYDEGAPLAKQVEQSFESSLDHLGVDYLDSYVLHAPEMAEGLIDDDWTIWRAMEALHRVGSARLLGVSNVTLAQLTELYRKSKVKPAFVQNRVYAVRGWDRDIRAFCRANGIVYQGFSVLTANVPVLSHPFVKRIAKRNGATPAAVILRFALGLGMIVLTGTRSIEHMKDDLGAHRVSMSEEELQAIETIAT